MHRHDFEHDANISQSTTLAQQFKPAILQCFGDIAGAIGGHFETYLSVVAQVLEQASTVQAGADGPYEMYDYVISLREGIMDAWGGIIGAMKTSDKSMLNIYGYKNQVLTLRSRSLEAIRRLDLPAPQLDCHRPEPQRVPHEGSHGCHWVSFGSLDIIRDAHLLTLFPVTWLMPTPAVSSPMLSVRIGSAP